MTDRQTVDKSSSSTSLESCSSRALQCGVRPHIGGAGAPGVWQPTTARSAMCYVLHVLTCATCATARSAMCFYVLCAMCCYSYSVATTHKGWVIWGTQNSINTSTGVLSIPISGTTIAETIMEFHWKHKCTASMCPSSTNRQTNATKYVASHSPKE